MARLAEYPTIVLQNTKIKDPHHITNKPSCVRNLQRAVDRLIMGHYRYGVPQPAHKYLKRLRLAADKYERTGNQEYLVDAIAYCLLELDCPTISKSVHFTPLDSQGKNWRI